jgi:ABC-type phosphate transport system ATPase subunit
MDILNRFERRAIEDIRLDKEIDADNYESVGRHILIMKIRKAIGMAFRKDWPKSSYSIEDILKPGKLWD